MRTPATAPPETLRVRRYEPSDKRAVRRLHDDALHRLDTTVQQRVAKRLYLENGYQQAVRGSIGAFDCVFYERKDVA